MKTKNHKFLICILLSISGLFLTSCSGIIGYSVLLWNIPEQNLQDGTIVPVYIKSNISHVYVIGLPDSKEKIEVPIWKITEPAKKSKTIKAAKRYAEYQTKYAKCVLDGLPIRADKVNTSKQVYRLRKDEIVRTLYEGTGAIPTNGKANLEGKWLRVLTHDGTQGWCFSYNLRVFVMNADGTLGEGAAEAQIKEEDEVLNNLLENKWYPDYYSRMISTGNFNLKEFKEDFGFDTGFESGKVKIKNPGIDVEYIYSGTEKIDDGIYKFTDIPVQVTVRNAHTIVVQHTDDKGKPRSYNFVTLKDDVDIAQLITDELERRKSVYEALRKDVVSYKSPAYGQIKFFEDNTFSWGGSSIKLAFAPSTQKNIFNGTVSFEYLLPRSLKAEYDGIITLKFDDASDKVSFFYKRIEEGLRFVNVSVKEELNNTTNRTTYTVTPPVNPQVMFFAKVAAEKVEE